MADGSSKMEGTLSADYADSRRFKKKKISKAGSVFPLKICVNLRNLRMILNFEAEEAFSN